MQLTRGRDPHRFEITTVAVSMVPAPSVMATGPMVSMAARGDIDLATAPLLLAALLGAIEKHAPVLLELDLSGSTFMDARGVSVLLQTYAAARGIDCRVRLVRTPRHIRRVLDVTGVGSVWEMVN